MTADGRIFVEPKGMPPTQIAHRAGVRKKTVDREEWKKYVKVKAWDCGDRNAQKIPLT